MYRVLSPLGAGGMGEVYLKGAPQRPVSFYDCQPTTENLVAGRDAIVDNVEGGVGRVKPR